MNDTPIKRYMWVDEYAYGSLTRAITWRQASALVGKRHPAAGQTVSVFRDMMRHNAQDAVRRARMAKENNLKYGLYGMKGVA